MATQPSSEPILSCRGVRKVYRAYRRQPGWRGLAKNFFAREVEEFVALAGIDLVVARGELVGLIGANGAGKTTLVKCLTGIIPVSEGEVRTLGCAAFELSDVEKRRLAIVMGQRSQLWWDLAPIDSFRLLQAIYGVPEDRFRALVDEYAERLEVTDRLDVQLRQLSLGQRMKMEIIGAFLHEPELVFLDEPTIGLDLVSRETIRQFLVEINRVRAATIVLTSHDMEDIEETCERLLILESGRLLYDGSLVVLQQRTHDERRVRIHLEPGRAPEPGSVRSMQRELERYGARLAREAPLTLDFVVAADRVREFVPRLFEWFRVHDVSIERQPLEQLVKQIFETQALRATARAQGVAAGLETLPESRDSWSRPAEDAEDRR